MKSCAIWHDREYFVKKKKKTIRKFSVNGKFVFFFIAHRERSVERNIICRLCNDPMIETTVELQHHLLSRVHVDRLNAIESTLIAIYGGKAQNK